MIGRSASAVLSVIDKNGVLKRSSPQIVKPHYKYASKFEHKCKVYPTRMLTLACDRRARRECRGERRAYNVS